MACSTAHTGRARFCICFAPYLGCLQLAAAADHSPELDLVPSAELRGVARDVFTVEDQAQQLPWLVLEARRP